MMSPAGPEHGRIAMRVGRLLDTFVDQHGLGAVYAAETGFLIRLSPDTVRAPDVAFVRAARVNLAPKTGFFPGAPDLAVEVLSPSDAKADVMDKTDEWLKAGSAEVWLIDPSRKSIATCVLDRPQKILRDRDELACESLLPGFCVLVAEVFR